MMNSNTEVTVSVEELESLRKKACILQSLQHTAHIGWWKADFTSHTLECSDIVQNLLNLKEPTVTFEDFKRLIHPDHRERVTRNFALFSDVGFYDEKFPLMTRLGYLWAHAHLDRGEADPGGYAPAEGFIRYLDETEATLTSTDVSQRRLNELFARQNSLSQSLRTLLLDPDKSDVITETLEQLLTQFDGDRVYIFEYDWEKRTHTCRYEATRPGINPEIDHLQDMPVAEAPWWTQQLSNQQPIILNDLNELPEEAASEKEILALQDIRSIIVGPLVSQEGVWGYLGVDMVGRWRIWDELDRQWFFSIVNIIGICLKLKRSEIEIRQEKVYFQNLYMHMPMAYVKIEALCDAAGRPVDYRIVELNPAFEEITGIPTAAILGESLLEPGFFVTEETIADVQAVIFQRGVVSGKKVRMRNNRYFNAMIYPSGNRCCSALFTDVTEESLAQKALRRSEKMLQNIYNGISAGIEIYDKDGYLIDINDEELRIFGLENKEQALGVNLFENPNIPEEDKAALRNKQNIEFALDYDFGNINKLKYYSSRRSGVIKVFAKSSILYDAAGEVENYILIVVDNTESYRASHQLHEFESLFEHMSVFAKIGLCRWNFSSDNFTATDQWCRNVNQSPHAFGNIFDAYTNVHPDDFKRLRQYLLEAAGGKRDTFRDELRIRDGQDWKWIRCNYMVRTGGTDGDGIMGLNIDITELKQTELRLTEAKLQAEESDRLKSAFLANMSHEIRTPLNAIVGFSNLLIDTQEDDERQQYVSIIQHNNEQLLQLINDILDLSKIEAGMFEPSYGDIDVNKMCEELRESYLPDATHPVPVVFERPLPECRISSDRSKLIQVLSNLLSNARKFTKEGYIRIGYKPLQQNEIEFFVQDTGIGIAEESREEVFNRFIKLNDFAQGTGLGLAICKNIVEKLGGRIGVDSEPGKGSRFWFVCPCTPQIAEEPEFPEFPLPAKAPVSRATVREKPLVLVAEDADSNYLLIAALLKADYELIRARNGAEAVELFFARKPDAVLMDMKMPELDGLEATRRIREKNRQTPIIALTAFAYASDREQAIAAGCDEYLTKPLDAAALKSVLAERL